MKRTLATLFLASSLILTACDTSDAEYDTDEQSEPVEDSSEEASEGQADMNNDDHSNEVSDDEEDVAIDEPEESSYLFEVNENDIATIQVIEGEEANERVALLTYDDAQDNYAVDIAEALVEHDAPAIFFFNGMFIESE